MPSAAATDTEPELDVVEAAHTTVFPASDLFESPAIMLLSPPPTLPGKDLREMEPVTLVVDAPVLREISPASAAASPLAS